MRGLGGGYLIYFMEEFLFIFEKGNEVYFFIFRLYFLVCIICLKGRNV